MKDKKNPLLLSKFLFNGKDLRVTFVETVKINNSVNCDVYTFDGDDTKDLGIIKIKPGGRTPLQKVLKGDRTIEGYISGRGRLTIFDKNGNKKEFVFDKKPEISFSITVGVGEIMQWEADRDSELVVYEICFPPYEDGRYENL